MANYPSTISAFTNPLSTNRLNAPSHSAIETAQNTDLTAIETFLGTEGNTSTIGTLIYDVRSPGSNGGGHVQTANKGGTGQTTFALGDLLVGQSSSVLVKNAVGNDGQILSANSSTASGIQWINNVLPKVTSSASIITSNSNTPVSIIAINIPGSTLGTSNVLRATVFGNDWRPRAPITVTAKYGGATVASVILSPRILSNNYDSGGLTGNIDCTILANNSATAQETILRFNLTSTSILGDVSSIYSAFSSSTSSVNSGQNQYFQISVTPSSNTGPDTTIGGYLIEKIS